MSKKRPDGTLEHDIMAVLWGSTTPLLPSEIQDRLPLSLAYTSVATVLGRLHHKALVDRSPAGRAFAYTAAMTEEQYVANRVAEVLASASNRGAALAGFAGALSKREAAQLRNLLDR